VYIGTGLVNGIFCHRWLDGTSSPVFRGGATDGNSDGDGGGDGDKSDGDESDDEDDDDEDDDSGKSKDDEKKPDNRLSRENAKYRIRAKERTAQRDAAIAERDEARAELEKLKKDGVTDEATKKRLQELEDEVKTLRAERAKAQAERMEADLERSVAEALEDLDIDCEADVALSRLRKNGVQPDDEGEIEDLDKHLKRLLKKGVFKKIVASGDEDEDEDDGDKASSGAGATRSGRPVTSRNGKPKKGAAYDKAALAKKYPALRR
jgi:hypothetical protein